MGKGEMIVGAKGKHRARKKKSVRTRNRSIEAFTERELLKRGWGIEWVVKNELSMFSYLQEWLPQLIPGIKRVRISNDFPDLIVELKNGTKVFYELEYKLSNFLLHGHHYDDHPCNGIIYWINDISDPYKLVALDKYRLLCLKEKILRIETTNKPIIKKKPISVKLKAMIKEVIRCGS